MSKKIITQKEYDLYVMTFGQTKTDEEFEPDTPDLIKGIVSDINTETQRQKGDIETRKMEDMKGGNIQTLDDLHKYRNGL